MIFLQYSKVLFYLMVPLLGATLIAKAVYYPISDFTGANFCFFVTYTYYWVGIFGQSLTFFMTIFRYICLYHEVKLLRWHIKPKVSFLCTYFIKNVMCILILPCLLFLEFFPNILTYLIILLSMIVLRYLILSASFYPPWLL